MPARDTQPVVRFGPFELDLRAGDLRRSGTRLPLQGRPLQVLAILLRNPGEIVTAEQLRGELWPADTFVDFEHGVHNAVARLRAVLGDTAEKPRYIGTVPRKGYRFIGSVEAAEPVAIAVPEPPPPTVPVAAPRRRNLAVLVALAVLLTAGLLWIFRPWAPGRARITSLAVLPLENLSGDNGQDYFADGVTDELITALAKANVVRVISRTSVMQYRSARKPLPQIARELGVDGVVEGTLARSGDRVRLTVQLIYAPADRHVWAERYERDTQDIVILENQIARTIVKQIQGAEASSEALPVRQVNAEAYQLYLKGRYFWNQRTAESIRKAIGYFSEALARDANYAPAYSGLADCYSSLGFSFDVGDTAPNEAGLKAIAAAERAITLDGSLAEAHTSLAFIKLNYVWDWPGAEAEFRRAIALNPGLAAAHHWYAHRLIAERRFGEAEAESRRALELDPLSPILNVHLGWHYFYARQYGRALEQLRRTLELDPHYGLAYWYRGLVFEQQGNYPDALREMRHAKDLLPGNHVIDSDIGHAEALAGHRAAALEILGELRRLRSQAYVSPFEIALIHMGLGERAEAFAALEQAYRERSDMLVYLKVDPRLDPLRSDPRFTDLARRIGIAP